jgi:hypothetical protein
VVALLADEGNMVRDCNAKLLRAVARESRKAAARQSKGGSGRKGFSLHLGQSLYGKSTLIYSMISLRQFQMDNLKKIAFKKQGDHLIPRNSDVTSFPLPPPLLEAIAT